jgi:hypothetical protein
MILSPYFPKFKEINALRAQAGYGFMKMNAQQRRVARAERKRFLAQHVCVDTKLAPLPETADQFKMGLLDS